MLHKNLIIVICLIFLLIYIINRNHKYSINLEGFKEKEVCKNNSISLYDDLINTSNININKSDTRLKNLKTYYEKLKSRNNEPCFTNQTLFSNCEKDLTETDENLYELYDLNNIKDDKVKKKTLEEIKKQNKIKCDKIKETCIKAPEGVKFLTADKVKEYIEKYEKNIEKKMKNKNINVSEYICKKCKLCDKVEEVCDEECLDDCRETCDKIDDDECKESCDIVDKQFKITNEGGKTFLEQKLALMEQHEKKRSSNKSNYELKKNDSYNIFKIKDILIFFDSEKYNKFTKGEFVEGKVYKSSNNVINKNYLDFTKNQITQILKKYNYTDNEIEKVLKEYDDKFGSYQNVSLSQNTLDSLFGRNYKVEENNYKDYASATDENRDILDETSYDYKSGWTTLPPSAKSTTTMKIPNLPEFYNMFDIKTLPQMEYSEQRDLPYKGSNSNIYRTYYKPIVDF